MEFSKDANNFVSIFEIFLGNCAIFYIKMCSVQETSLPIPVSEVQTKMYQEQLLFYDRPQQGSRTPGGCNEGRFSSEEVSKTVGKSSYIMLCLKTSKLQKDARRNGPLLKFGFFSTC